MEFDCGTGGPKRATKEEKGRKRLNHNLTTGQSKPRVNHRMVFHGPAKKGPRKQRKRGK